MQPSLLIVFGGSLVFGVPSTTRASREGPTTPDWRGTPGASYQGWESFSVATDDGIGNRPDLPGSSPRAVLTQRSPEAFLSGSGTIYNPSGVSSFTIQYSAADNVGAVILQACTLGSELDYSSVRLSCDTGGGPLFLTAARIENDCGTVPGTGVSSQSEWNLAGSGASSFSISFTAADASLSFDAATLDSRSVGVVPEPSTRALMAEGAMGLAGASRRIRRG